MNVYRIELKEHKGDRQRDVWDWLVYRQLAGETFELIASGTDAFSSIIAMNDAQNVILCQKHLVRNTNIKKGEPNGSHE